MSRRPAGPPGSGPSRTGWVEENICLGQCLPPGLGATPSQRQLEDWGLGLECGVLPLTGLMVLGRVTSTLEP